MTRKDYELIANCLFEIQDDECRSRLARKFGAELLATNPRFNLSVFLIACATIPLPVPTPRSA